MRSRDSRQMWVPGKEEVEVSLRGAQQPVEVGVVDLLHRTRVHGRPLPIAGYQGTGAIVSSGAAPHVFALAARPSDQAIRGVQFSVPKAR
jgi:hypothetical protein